MRTPQIFKIIRLAGADVSFRPFFLGLNSERILIQILNKQVIRLYFVGIIFRM